MCQSLRPEGGEGEKGQMTSWSGKALGPAGKNRGERPVGLGTPARQWGGDGPDGRDGPGKCTEPKHSGMAR